MICDSDPRREGARVGARGGPSDDGSSGVDVVLLFVSSGVQARPWVSSQAGFRVARSVSWTLPRSSVAMALMSRLKCSATAFTGRPTACLRWHRVSMAIVGLGCWRLVDLACEVPPQATDGVALGVTLGGPPDDVVDRAGVLVGQANQHEVVDRCVGQPTRCWSAVGGGSGPVLDAKYCPRH